MCHADNETHGFSEIHPNSMRVRHYSDEPTEFIWTSLLVRLTPPWKMSQWLSECKSLKQAKKGAKMKFIYQTDCGVRHFRSHAKRVNKQWVSICGSHTFLMGHARLWENTDMYTLMHNSKINSCEVAGKINLWLRGHRHMKNRIKEL